MASPLPISDVPPEVQAEWDRAHDAYQAQLEYMWERGASGKGLNETHFERGRARLVEVQHLVREQLGGREERLQATRRRGKP